MLEKHLRTLASEWTLERCASWYNATQGSRAARSLHNTRQTEWSARVRCEWMALCFCLFSRAMVLTGDTVHDSCNLLSSLSGHVVVSSFVCALGDLRFHLCDRFHGSRERIARVSSIMVAGVRNRIHVGIDGSCDVWDSQQRVDELPTHRRSAGRVGSSSESSRRPCHHRAWPTQSRTSAGHGPM